MKRFRQTPDILSDMELGDERVRRDARILRILRDAVMRTVTNPALRLAVKSNPALYSRYDTSAFPLREAKKPKLPAWRFLTPWMKVQVASLALAERGYLCRPQPQIGCSIMPKRWNLWPQPTHATTRASGGRR